MKRLLCVFRVLAAVLFAGCGQKPEPVSAPSPSPEPAYESPIDFEKWQGENRDIYAYIKLPGTHIDYPVLSSSPDDPDYYLRKDLKGEYSVAGCLYTQSSYNSNDFSDRVTIIYGHNMPDGSMFGDLQNTFSDRELFRQNNVFTIYLPDREMDYEVIAGLPYSNLHILAQYDNFDADEKVKDFLTRAMSTEHPEANSAKGYEPTGREKLVILQTCNNHDYSQRYIVIGKLSETRP